MFQYLHQNYNAVSFLARSRMDAISPGPQAEEIGWEVCEASLPSGATGFVFLYWHCSSDGSRPKGIPGTYQAIQIHRTK